ncbi:MAG: ABC transporter substrate-binding protein [Pseudomonadota bacterium]
MRMILALALIAGLTAPAAAEPTMRVAVLKFGTVNWLMDTITTHGLDKANGFELDVVPLAGKSATTIALQSGDADAIVTDWVWAMRQHQAGTPYKFLPYSRSLGALMVRPEAEVADLCDLKGREIGVVGGAIDKSWLVLQALVAKKCGYDLAAETQSLFGAPPLMSRQLESDEVDAVSTFWHFAARLEASGNTRMVGITEALADLEIAPAPPLIGFVWNPENTDDRPGLIANFANAVKAASEILGSDDAEWERLRPKMKAKSDAEFTLLRDYYRAGIVSTWTAEDTAAANALHEALIGIGGQAYRNTSGPFIGEVFPDTSS